jgi:hypothetical protein
MPVLNTGTAVPQWDIDYQYLGGVAYWYDPSFKGKSYSPVKLTVAKPVWVLAADDINLKADTGTWAASSTLYIPHVRHGTQHPDGANEVMCDGSVGWYKFETLYFLTSWDLNWKCYMYQVDLPVNPPGPFGPGSPIIWQHPSP